VRGSATSTFTSSGVNINGALDVDGTATSTFSNGLRIENGSLQLSQTLGCNGTSVLETDAAGNLQCGADGGGGGAFTSSGGFTTLNTESDRVGIGSSTPGAKLTVATTIGETDIPLFIVASSSDGTATTTYFLVQDRGNVNIGTTTGGLSEALLTLDKNGGHASTSLLVGGIDQYYQFDLSGGGTQFGNRMFVENNPQTNSNVMVAQIIRVRDNTTLANTVRGLEVQAHRGTNTEGENTAISAFARTFGVRTVTEGDAGSVATPAALFAETRGTTQGNAIRGFFFKYH